MNGSRNPHHQYTNSWEHNNSVALLYEMIEKINTDPELVKAIIDDPSNHNNFKTEELIKKRIAFTPKELKEFNDIRIQKGAKYTFAYLLARPEAVMELLKPANHEFHLDVPVAEIYLKEKLQAKIITYLVNHKTKLSDIKQSDIESFTDHQVAGKKLKKYRKKSKKNHKKSKKHHKKSKKSRNKRR